MRTLCNSIGLEEVVPSSSAMGAPALLDASPALALTLPNRPITNDLAGELAVAHAIQQSLLPKTFPEVPGFGLSGFCQSAREVGGDFYDALPLGEGSVLLVVADVMGKGVPAALFAASLRMLVRSMAQPQMSPSELLARINEQMYVELSSVDMFITAQLALVDTKRGRLRIASAGHCPFLMAARTGETYEIAPEGLPLGIQQDASFGEEAVPLDTCACALLYTDGLTEASDGFGNLFGLERLAGWLSQRATENQTAAQLRDDFLLDLKRFEAHSLNRDDLTLIVLARENGPGLAAP